MSRAPYGGDVVIAAEGCEFRADRVVLAGRSPVFRAMFAHPSTVESVSGRVEINDLSADVVDALLTFMYTGSVPDVKTLAAELLVAADKYDLPTLKALCVNELVLNVSPSNAAQLFIIAEQHGADKLKRKAIEVLYENQTTKK